MTRKLTVAAVISALAVGFMLLSIIPLATIVVPAIAGALLIIIVTECGDRLAFAAFATVSLLSFFVVPDRDAVSFFFCIFGWYPLVKQHIERKFKKAIIKYAIKIVLFYLGLAVLSGSMLFLYDSQWISGIAAPFAIIALIVGAPIFVIYDLALTRVTEYYNKIIRPKIFRK